MTRNLNMLNENADVIGAVEIRTVNQKEVQFHRCDENARSIRVSLVNSKGELEFMRGMVTDGACIDYSNSAAYDALKLIGSMLGMDLCACTLVEVASNLNYEYEIEVAA